MRKEDAQYHKNVASNMMSANNTAKEVRAYAPQAPVMPEVKKGRGVVGKVADYFGGITRVDNEANPFSALSRRNAATKANKVNKEFMDYVKKTGKVR